MPLEEDLFKKYVFEFVNGTFTKGKQAASEYKLGYINETLMYMKIIATSISSADEAYKITYQTYLKWDAMAYYWN